MGGLFEPKNRQMVDDSQYEPLLAGTAKLWPGTTNYEWRKDRYRSPIKATSLHAPIMANQPQAPITDTRSAGNLEIFLLNRLVGSDQMTADINRQPTNDHAPLSAGPPTPRPASLRPARDYPQGHFDHDQMTADINRQPREEWAQKQQLLYVEDASRPEELVPVRQQIAYSAQQLENALKSIRDSAPVSAAYYGLANGSWNEVLNEYLALDVVELQAQMVGMKTEDHPEYNRIMGGRPFSGYIPKPVPEAEWEERKKKLEGVTREQPLHSLLLKHPQVKVMWGHLSEAERKEKHLTEAELLVRYEYYKKYKEAEKKTEESGLTPLSKVVENLDIFSAGGVKVGIQAAKSAVKAAVARGGRAAPLAAQIFGGAAGGVAGGEAKRHMSEDYLEKIGIQRKPATIGDHLMDAVTGGLGVFGKVGDFVGMEAEAWYDDLKKRQQKQKQKTETSR